MGVGWPKISRRRGRPPPTILSFQKTRINVLSYGIKIWTDLSSILSQITRLTDRQTDGRTDRIFIARPRLHFMQRGKNRAYYIHIFTVLASYLINVWPLRANEMGTTNQLSGRGIVIWIRFFYQFALEIRVRIRVRLTVPLFSHFLRRTTKTKTLSSENCT